MKLRLLLLTTLLVAPDMAAAQQLGPEGRPPTARPAVRPAPARPARPPQATRPTIPPIQTRPARPARPGGPQVQPARPGGPQIQPPRPGHGGPGVRPPRPTKPVKPVRPPKPTKPPRPGHGGHRPPSGGGWHRPPSWGNGGRPPNFRPIHRPGFQYPSGYRYRRWAIGLLLPSIFLSSSYYFDDYYNYGLPQPPMGYRWVRYGPDLLLVWVATGRVEDVIYDAFE